VNTASLVALTYYVFNVKSNSMPDEIPQPGKFVVSGYSAGDPAYPIVIVVKANPALGYTPPAIGSLCPDDRFPAHQFVGITPTNIDNRVIWTYKLMPGPTVTSWEHDPETDTFISRSKTEDFLSDITPSLVRDDDDTVTITEEEAIDANTGYRVVEVIPKGDFYSEATAQIEYKLRPFEHPGYLMSYGEFGGATITTVSLFGPGIGVRKASSGAALHTIKTWWEIGTTPPTLTYDEINPGDLSIGSDTYRHILHDEYTGDYNGFPVTVPATVPSFTEYYGTPDALDGSGVPPDPFAPGTGTKWIGTARVIDGGVTRAGSKFRHKVVKITVVMR
jgi:hypothetical protein